MSLKSAHEGYEYQDLLTAYFILQEILENNESTFIIDKKMYATDKFDDLSFSNASGTFKRQIKYSNEDSAHTLAKNDISADSTYDLALDALYTSWLNRPLNTNYSIRLCLAWNEPLDDLKSLLCSTPAKSTFSNFSTTLFKIDVDKLWPPSDTPLKSWRRLNSASKTIDRVYFCQFCDELVFELNLPKFSLNIYAPGQLEQIVLDQVNKIGIGLYPNNNLKSEEFVLALLSLIKRARSKHAEITTKQIFSEFQIRTDYGCIEQSFPIDQSKNIDSVAFFDVILNKLSAKKKILLTGEPGSGKSWLIENLISKLSAKNVKVIHHYCYVDMADELQKERIKLDVFYGNLISDILKAFPHLSDIKQSKYASNLSELNLLLQNINEQAVLIIDGLDHIRRLFDFHSYPDLTLSEIEIIEAIGKLSSSDNLQILITSQKIKDLAKISGYFEMSMPNWSKTEILLLMQKVHIPDLLISNRLLSDYLSEKSNGNPLYLNYLIEEIKKIQNLKLSDIQTLPDYSYNLSYYYEYLLTRLNANDDVPRILSAVNFCLTKSELVEITGVGDYVTESLELISPVIKLNISQNGYIIYHESFRRFIIDKLLSKSVSLEKAVFNPIIDWFSKKDFYSYAKSYRYYLQFLFNCKRYEMITEYITYSFVTDSVFYGHSWELISKNYRYLVAAGLAVGDFSKIIIVNEISKLISSTENSYDESFHLYFDALGHFRGFKTVLDYLSYDEKPTLSLKNGLEACYLCDSNDMQAPWDIYYEYFSTTDGIKIEDFKFYLRYHLAKRNVRAIVKIAHNAVDKNLAEYEKELCRELTGYKNVDLIEELTNTDSIISKVVGKTQVLQPQLQDLRALSKQIVDCKHIFDNEVPLILSFFAQIKLQLQDSALMDEIILLFRDINWFYNWIIYCIQIFRLQASPSTTASKIQEAFALLIIDTEPFKGEPRTCDLYSIREIIYSTINEGLSLVKNHPDCWKNIIDKLVILSDKTTTSLEKSLGGPLPTHKLFEILEENSCPENIRYVVSVFESQIESNKNHNLHSYIAEYYFRLSKIYSVVHDNGKAELALRKGVEFMLGYTMRRDLTIEDLIESVVSISKVDKEAGINGIRKLKPLVDSVVQHTDGKDTRHFPVEWFSKYLEIDSSEAAKYLCHELLQTRYDWRLEDSLLSLLKKANGDINPAVEFFIIKTFIADISEPVLSYCIELSEKIKVSDSDSAAEIIQYTYTKATMRNGSKYSAAFIKRLNSKCKKCGINNQKQINTEDEASGEKYATKAKPELIHRKNFADMSSSELLDYIQQNKLKDIDLNSLIYVFDDKSNLTSDTKELIKALILKNIRYDNDSEIDLDILFQNHSEVSVYYLVARFVYDWSGWFEHLINIEAFKKAYAINPSLAIQYLTELLSDKLSISFNRDVSANLINALVAVKYDSDKTKNMWSNLYEMTSYRLPVKQEYNWSEALSNELKMTSEEILICILFTRFKANTSERFHITLCSIAYLLYHSPNKLVNPIKWFLKNKEEFLEVILLILLELVSEYNKSHPGYANKFAVELKGIYPQRNYLIDFIIEKLLSLPSLSNLSASQSMIYPVEEEFIEFFIDLNIRHSKIKQAGIDIENIFGKYRATFSKKYQEKFDLYHNRLHEISVKHIYCSNYMLELINKDLCTQLKSFANQNTVFDSIKVELQPLIAQHISQTARTECLKKPSQWSDNSTKNSVEENCDWVRIAHYETELHELEHYKLEEITIYGGLTFTNKASIFPFGSYRLFPEEIYSQEAENHEMKECAIVSFIQKYDPLEDFKLLWIDAPIFNELKLSVNDFMLGLSAKNEEGITVLKYNSWHSDYFEGSGIRDEIPKLDGAELLIRKDYYAKICSLFNKEPSYCTYKIMHKGNTK